MRRLPLLFLLVCGPIAQPLWSQAENLTEDESFFLQQKAGYQRWLDAAGLGRYLRVQDLRVEPERVRLYLGFYAADADTIRGIWEQIKSAHDAQGGPKLEEYLLFRMCNMMSLRQQAAVIEVYDTYDLSREPLFFRGIYYDGGLVRVVEQNPRGAQLRHIMVQPSDIKTGSRRGRVDFSKQYTREYVFGQVLQFMQRKYAQSPCDHRKPEIHLKPHEEYLRFDVSDLCREVIKDAQNPTICQWLRLMGYSCNWTTRELLSFTFVYVPTQNGFSLHLTLEGRVGSGFYKDVKRRGYMDMELDFKQELEEYADAIALEIKKYLTR